MDAEVLLNDFIDFKFKVIVVGDSGAGKTSLLLRHKISQFLLLNPTCQAKGFPSHSTEHSYFADTSIDGYSVRLLICDPCGQDMFKLEKGNFFHNVKGVIYCCSLGPPNLLYPSKTLARVMHWRREVARHVLSCSTARIVEVLVGTKSDLVPDFTENSSKIKNEIKSTGEDDMISLLDASVLHYILSSLPVREICRCSQLSKMWFRVANHEVLWQKLFYQHFNNSCTDFIHKFATWKLEYKNADNNTVTPGDIEDLSKMLSMPYHLTSARVMINVTELFDDIARMLLAEALAADPSKRKSSECECEHRSNKQGQRKMGFFNSLFK